MTGTKSSHHPLDIMGNKSIQLADILANDCGRKLIILQFWLGVLHHSVERLVGKASISKNYLKGEKDAIGSSVSLTQMIYMFSVVLLLIGPFQTNYMYLVCNRGFSKLIIPESGF